MKTFQLTNNQEKALSKLEQYLKDIEPNGVFVIRGYAGTGKTSIMSIIAVQNRKRAILLAPTGRAAKVFKEASGIHAATIHHHIYRSVISGGKLSFRLNKNPHEGVIYLVDEASLIQGGYTGNNLLNDLIKYVHSNRGNKLVLCGDPAQLPPVGMDLSPALDEEYLEDFAGLMTQSSLIQEVIRQKQDSGILKMATSLRSSTPDMNGNYQINLREFPDVQRVQRNDVIELIEDEYAQNDVENVMIITRSNKMAMRYNQYIRQRIMYREEEIERDDILMVVKNNYYWPKESGRHSFIANGEMIRLIQPLRHEKLYGQSYLEADVENLSEGKEFTVQLWLNTLYTDKPAMEYEQVKKVEEAVREEMEQPVTKTELKKELSSNDFYQALQIKYAYAITCHKAQGGQWPVVFVDYEYLMDKTVDEAFIRWLYTAVTRATRKVYLVQFDENFFSE
ncbi:MAG TPA: ATP-dependent endonuclease [Flavobacteriales bacterium]|nr:ATP-dependent endonuclease [Flavobacteriales bacterium]